MTFSFESKDQQEVWQVIRNINDAWRNGRPEDIEAFFDDDIVIVHPNFQGRAKGKKVCVESYKDFCRQAKIHDYKESNPSIDVFGDTAVASYSFDITYEMNAVTTHETGHDLFVLLRKGANWKAVWRTLISISSE